MRALDTRASELAMPRSLVGTVIEIRTRKGLAYALVSHEVPGMGGLLRVLPGFHSKLDDVAKLLEAKPRFVVFFPVRQAIQAGIVRVWGTVAVPDAASRFPLFRAAGLRGIANGPVWLWDGSRRWRDDSLRDRDLPIEEVWNDTMLVARIEDEDPCIG